MVIANNFYDFLNLDFIDEKMQDVWLVGSLASYNWNEIYSDLDLHILVDYDKISMDHDLLDSQFAMAKNLYNETHDLEINGFNVELYVQDINEHLESNGIYSVMRQTWIKHPKKETPKINKKKVLRFATELEQQINKALALYRAKQYKAAIRKAEQILEDMKDMRKNGLKLKGEFSSENLAYKLLRRSGALDKLNKLKRVSFDQAVSIGEKKPKKAKKAPQPVDNKVKRPKDDNYTDEISYLINGKPYPSLRVAAKELNIPKSTIEYRVKSPDFKGYTKVTG
jgi:tetratricopeptide (TPR) repeat protein